MLQKTEIDISKQQQNEPTSELMDEQVTMQEGIASNSLVQVGRDYIRYLQINFEAGNWIPIFVNAAFLGLIFYGITSATRSAITYAEDVQTSEGLCSPRVQKLALAFSREVARNNAALPEEQRLAILAIPEFQGPQGNPGARGEQGIPGKPGKTGPVGPEGKAGPQGEQGEKGERGEKGEKGIPGTKGEKGAVGSRGPQGMQGEKGTRGAVGPQGAQGVRGEKGARGATGPRGAQGIQGVRGPVGSRGPRGQRGEKGDRGIPGQDAVQPTQVLQ